MSSLDAETAPSGGATVSAEPTRVLFVCTHNSARSIMAEALLRHHDGGAFAAFSAGIEPGEVQPMTLRVLRDAGLATDGLRSKSVAEFSHQRFDHVVTVCASAREHCPTFPGGGMRSHWEHDDPSAATGTEEQRLAVFRKIYAAIDRRIEAFVRAERRMGH